MSTDLTNGTQPAESQGSANSGGTQPGNGSSTVGDSSPTSGNPSPNAGLYTKDAVDKIVQERLVRERLTTKKTFDEKVASEREAAVNSWRAENGLDDDAALEQWKHRAEAQSKEAQLSLKAKNLERETASLRAELATEKKARATERAILEKTLTHDRIMKIASAKSNAPDIVAEILVKRLRLDGDNNAFVAGEDGEPTGETIEQLVDKLLADRPMLMKPAGSPGSGSRPANGGASSGAKPDMSKKTDRLAALSAGYAASRGSSQ